MFAEYTCLLWRYRVLIASIHTICEDTVDEVLKSPVKSVHVYSYVYPKTFIYQFVLLFT